MRGRTRNSSKDRNGGRCGGCARFRVDWQASERATYLTSYLVSVPLPLAACSRWLDAAPLDSEDLCPACVLCDRRLTLSWIPGLYWYLYAIAHNCQFRLEQTPRSIRRASAPADRHLVSFGTWVSQGAFTNEGRDGGGELL